MLTLRWSWPHFACLTFLIVLLLTNASEICGREAIKPMSDIEVGQMIPQLDGSNLDQLIERGPPCSLDIQKDLPRPNQVQPLYLKPNSANYWLPNAKGHLQIPRGAIIELYCPESFANVSSGTAGNNDYEKETGSVLVARRTRHIYARCLHERLFAWQAGSDLAGVEKAAGKMENRAELANLVCSKALRYRMERLQQPCGHAGDKGVHLHRIGYNVSDERFVSTMLLCHDEVQLRTLYVQYWLLPGNVHFQRNVKRRQFSQGEHFAGLDMKALYSMRHQRQRMQQLLGAAHVPDELLNEKAGLFLSRGHLAAKADFIYASQQHSSFNYLNVAPQWQSINGAQWLTLEDEARKFAARQGLTLRVYTGTWGVMHLPAAHSPAFYLAKGHDSSSHMAGNASSSDVVPVPQLFYRILIDENARPSRGIALLCVNNPHTTMAQILSGDVICEPVQHLVRWLRWLKPANLKKGYIYACSVADMTKVVTHLPAQLGEVHALLDE